MAATATAYAPNRYHRVHLHPLSLKNAHTKPLVGASLKGYSLNCITFRTATDAVCGSGYCHIVPYWAKRLEKDSIVAYQASSRGGTLYCRLDGTRVKLAGQAALYSISEIQIE